jgi:hypothetical protein
MQLVDTSKDYEKLAQEIYKNILALDGVENVEVLNDVKIKGRSGIEHQIDVFWQYKYAGIEHKVLIDCKYYTNPVSLIHARNMLGLVTDIPNSQGVIVTTQGYQSGVEGFANHYGIGLKLIRPPQGSDWDGCIQIVNIEGKAYQNNYLNIHIGIDGKDPETLESLGGETENISFNIFVIRLQDGDSSPLFIGKWLDRNIVMDAQVVNENKLITLEPKHTYIILDSGKRLKIQNIAVTCLLKLHEFSLSVDAMDFVKAVLQDFTSNEIEYTLTTEHKSLQPTRYTRG